MKNNNVLLSVCTCVLLILFSAQLSAGTITTSCSSKGGSGCFMNTQNGSLLSSGFSLSAQDCPGIVTDINISVNIYHNNISDLELYLQHDNQSATLFFQNCGSQNDIIGTFDDQALSGNICNISNNTDVQPINALSVHDGSNTEGGWFLKIKDLPANTTVGSLNDWSITITCEVPPPLPQISIEGGFIKLHTTNGGAPMDYYCSSAEGYGRMVFDETTDALYICGNAGWIIY